MRHKKKTAKSTAAIIRKNEEIKNDLLKYLFDNKEKNRSAEHTYCIVMHVAPLFSFRTEELKLMD